MTLARMTNSYFASQRHRRLAGEYFAAAVFNALAARVTDRAEAFYVAHCALRQPLKALSRACPIDRVHLRRLVAGVEDARDEPATNARLDALTAWAQQELIAC